MERCHCNSCGRPTAHDLISHREVEDQDDDSGFWWTDTYDTLECRGCKSVCLRHQNADATGDSEIVFYPPRISRRSPTWRANLPLEMRQMLDEIYRALHNDSSRLALMGARTLVDLLMTSEVGDTGPFKRKLVALQTKGVITSKHAEVLEAALDAGSAAAHRAYRPDPDDLNAVMDIVENLLQSVYHLGKLASRLKQTTPRRT